MASASGADDDGTVAGYRPVSAAAVAAAALGLASAVALVSPVLWVLPLVGVAVALAALADVGQPNAAKAGRLGLSLGFGAQAVTTAAATEWLARGRAEAAVRFWLDAIASGRLDDARSMCAADVAGAVDRVAGSGATSATVRHRRRDQASGERVVRAVVGDCAFDVVLAAAPPRRPGDPERLTVARCEEVTPSAR